MTSLDANRLLEPGPADRWYRRLRAALFVALLVEVSVFCIVFVMLPDPRPGRRYAAIANLQSLSRAIEQYRVEHQSLPASLAVVAGMRFIDPRELTDPWNRANRYEPRREGESWIYTLRSLGEDGIDGTPDDIVVQGGKLDQPASPDSKALPGR